MGVTVMTIDTLKLKNIGDLLHSFQAPSKVTASNTETSTRPAIVINLRNWNGDLCGLSRMGYIPETQKIISANIAHITNLLQQLPAGILEILLLRDTPAITIYHSFDQYPLALPAKQNQPDRFYHFDSDLSQLNLSLSTFTVKENHRYNYTATSYNFLSNAQLTSSFISGLCELLLDIELFDQLADDNSLYKCIKGFFTDRRNKTKTFLNALHDVYNCELLAARQSANLKSLQHDLSSPLPAPTFKVYDKVCGPTPAILLSETLRTLLTKQTNSPYAKILPESNKLLLYFLSDLLYTYFEHNSIDYYIGKTLLNIPIAPELTRSHKITYFPPPAKHEVK